MSAVLAAIKLLALVLAALLAFLAPACAAAACNLQTEPNALLQVATSNPTRSRSLLVADVGGASSAPDLIVCYADKVVWYDNFGGNVFAGPTVIVTLANFTWNGYKMVAGDIDGVGVMDIVLDHVWLVANNGTPGTPAWTLHVVPGAPVAGYGQSPPKMGDVRNDGTANDLVYPTSQVLFVCLYNASIGEYDPCQSVLARPEPSGVYYISDAILVDYSGDGLTDLVFADSST